MAEWHKIDDVGFRMKLENGLLTCKHINEISQADREEAKNLANEIKELLETYLLLPTEEAKPFIERAAKFRKKLEKIGFGVIVEISLSAQTLELTVDVELVTSTIKTDMVN